MHVATDWPAVASDPRFWTDSERRTVMFNRSEWIQRCLDYNEREAEIEKLLKFLEGKSNGKHQ